MLAFHLLKIQKFLFEMILMAKNHQVLDVIGEKKSGDEFVSATATFMAICMRELEKVYGKCSLLCGEHKVTMVW